MLNKIRKCGFSETGISFPERALNVHSAVTRCGYCRETSMKYSFDGLMRGKAEFAIWQFTLAGHGMLEYDGALQDVGPGQAMLLHIPHSHRYFLPRDSESWDFVYFCFNGRELLRILREIEHMNGPVLEHGEDSSVLKQAELIFMKATRREIPDIFSASSLAYDFAMNLARETCPHHGKGEARPEFLKKISDYCMENMDSDISVDTLAEIAGYSRYHFSRIFKKHMGAPPAEFVNNLRLKQAILLLQTERLSIKEISERCGFRNISYFCQAFKREFGMSPGKFKSGN
ncbi:MAG TPA: AraC family transcriptional regulator [Victivallales bacterium]|mgnify:CR=1 FL=1|nr:AraC family transcriptional regulator [Victivallales bacterium]